MQTIRDNFINRLTLGRDHVIMNTWSENHKDTSGNATDMRIFYTSFTGGVGNNQYPPRLLVSAFSATSGHSENDRNSEKKGHKMNNTNIPQIAEFSTEPIVINKRGTVMVSSRNIALVFGKEHKRVIRAIRDLCQPDQKWSGCTQPDFFIKNFRMTYYKDAHGQRRVAYNLTRDGFTLLAMGFTGARAMQFKIAYINAFNEMERKLTGNVAKSAPVRQITAPDTNTAPMANDLIAARERGGVLWVMGRFINGGATDRDRFQRMRDVIDDAALAYRMGPQIFNDQKNRGQK